ncbi:MAG: hypothetical protein H6673_14755 [Anaerolineales bacterium]|nr:hypothetical protein [Anaerolineales bacterium]
MKRPFLVLVFLLLASVACYSDSPLWVFGVTEVPPTATFLPTPDQELYPSRFTTDEITLAPQPTKADQAFFFVTSLPEELKSGARNAAGSCEYGSSLEILYIGHQFDNFKGDAYLDNLTLITAETSETLFDFEANAGDWVLDESREAGLAVAGQKDVDFNSQRAKPAEGQEAPDAANATTVLHLQGDYKGENWEVGTYTTFADGVDWSGQESISFEVFVPEKATNFYAWVYVKTGAEGTETASEPQRLDSGAWNTVVVPLALLGDVSDVRELGVRVGPSPARTYYLVVCTGTVGWANEERLAGPINFVRGQSALTLAKGLRGEDLPLDAGRPVFSIHDGTAPPISPNFPASKVCNVNEVVDILDVSAVEDATTATGFQVWYQIDCPQSGGRGWVIEDRLFGPLRLPAVNGLGIVMSDTEAPIDLTETAGATSGANTTVGTCTPSDVIHTLGFANLTAEDGSIQSYYNIDCVGIVGWTSQDPLIEIPYSLNSYVMIIGDEKRDTGVTEEDTTEDGTDTEATVTDEGDTTDTDTALLDLGAAANYLPVPITRNPEPAFEGNIEGTCNSGTVVQLEDVRSWEDLVFYQVTCGDVAGWLESRYLPNSVTYEIGSPVWFVRASKTSRGVPEEGYSIRGEPSRVGAVVGQCQLFSEAQVDGAIFEPKALRRLGFRLYYQITCLAIDGEEISGWVDQDGLSDTITVRNPYKLIGG